MIHLTLTGYHAGVPYCNTDRAQAREAGDTMVHGIYAPLHKPEYRARCCPACLQVWADEAYDDTDEMPDWVRELRDNGPDDIATDDTRSYGPHHQARK